MRNGGAGDLIVEWWSSCRLARPGSSSPVAGGRDPREPACRWTVSARPTSARRPRSCGQAPARPSVAVDDNRRSQDRRLRECRFARRLHKNSRRSAWLPVWTTISQFRCGRRSVAGPRRTRATGLHRHERPGRHGGASEPDLRNRVNRARRVDLRRHFAAAASSPIQPPAAHSCFGRRRARRRRPTSALSRVAVRREKLLAEGGFVEDGVDRPNAFSRARGRRIGQHLDRS